MAHISEVSSVEVYQYQGAAGALLFVHAVGEVATSGWSGIRLSPRFYVTPPADGLWEFDFEGHPPSGLVLEVVLPVSANYIGGVPAWFKGAKVYAAQNSMTSQMIKAASLARSPVALAFTAKLSGAHFKQELVSFDDSFNVIGLCSGFGSLHMKKLHHTLTLVVEGPDEAMIRRCVAEATGVGLIAAIVAVYATGGGALSAAISAFVAQLEGCLGNAFSVRIDDHSDWVEWCT
jgi:hypothetical protein